MKENFPPEWTKDYLWQWWRMDRMIELSDYQKCKEECNEIALKGKQCLPVSYMMKMIRLRARVAHTARFLDVQLIWILKNSMDVRCKEMINWEIINLIELGAIDRLLAHDIITKLATKPNYI